MTTPKPKITASPQALRRAPLLGLALLEPEPLPPEPLEPEPPLVPPLPLEPPLVLESPLGPVPQLVHPPPSALRASALLANYSSLPPSPATP